MSIAQRIYPHLPVAGQNLALAAFGLRYRRQRLGPGFDQYVAAFRERDRWSEEMMRSHTVQRLRELLLWSFQTVPYYTVRWQKAGIEEGDLAKMDVEDLIGLPITPKEDVRRDPTALVSTTLPRRPRLQRHLTSGSTGTPTTIYFTPQNVRQAMAVREARSFGWAGVSVRMPRSTIGARLVAPQAGSNGPAYRYNPIEHQLYLSAHHISRENLPSYVEGFNRYRPQVLTGFAYSHYLLARLMLAEGVRLQYQPQAAVLGSDKITPPMKATIAEAFGARAFEEYGAVENCVLATECTEGSLHVSPDFGILEILDADGAPAAPGQPGRLICTGLLNRAQPLIRYAIGDLGAWSKRHCSCGRDGLPVLESIVGRDTDVVVMRDGRRLNTAVALIFTGARGVAEGQVVQDGYEDFTIRVVPTTEFGAEQEEKLKTALRKRIGDVRIRVQTVEELEKTTSGKSRLVISRLRDNNDHNG